MLLLSFVIILEALCSQTKIWEGWSKDWRLAARWGDVTTQRAHALSDARKRARAPTTPHSLPSIALGPPLPLLAPFAHSLWNRSVPDSYGSSGLCAPAFELFRASVAGSWKDLEKTTHSFVRPSKIFVWEQTIVANKKSHTFSPRRENTNNWNKKRLEK